VLPPRAGGAAIATREQRPPAGADGGSGEAKMPFEILIPLLVYALIQRQVRLYLQSQQQFLPGNKGMTATPTAAVILSLFAPVAMVQLVVENREVLHVYGLQDHHRLVCDALGLARSWYEYEAPSGRQNCLMNVIPP
jgi:hypothetical protein